MAGQGVIVVGPDGQEYEFPPGSDPKRSAAIIKAKLNGGESEAQKPYHDPLMGRAETLRSSVRNEQSDQELAGVRSALRMSQGRPDPGLGPSRDSIIRNAMFPTRPRDDRPPEEPGMLESMGRRMFQGAAQPETGGDFLGLATAAPMMGVAAAGQGISKAVGAIRSRTPTQGGVGRLFSELAEGMPNPVGANPLVRPFRWAGKKLEERAASRAPQAVDGGTLVPDAMHARGGSTPAPPAPPPLPQSGPYHGSSGTGASAAPLQTPQVGWRQGSSPSGPVPDSRNATGSSRWFPERPAPPPPRPTATGTGASTNLQPTPNVGWKQGTSKPATSHARSAIIEQMKPDIRIPEQILADPKQLAIAAKALGLSVEELLKRQAQNFLSSNLNKF